MGKEGETSRQTSSNAPIVFLSYLLLSYLIYHPYRKEQVIGGSNGDVWPNLWGYAWVVEGVLSGKLPTFTTQVAYPPGGSLYFLDLEGALLSAPFQPVLPLAWVYNSVVLVETALSCFCAFLLARTLAGFLPSVVAGLAYGLNPYLLSSTYNGVTESLTAWWLPLLLLALRKRTVMWAVIAGVLAGLSAVGSWYYGVLAGMILALHFLWELRWSLLGASVRLVVSLSVFALFVSPFAFLLRSTLSSQSLITPHRYSLEPSKAENWRVRSKELDLVNLFLPGPKSSPPVAFSNTVKHTTYIGFVLPALAVLSLRGKRGRGFWVALCLCSIVLAGGFYLHIAGRVLSFLPLPGLLFAKVLPGYGSMEFPYRLVLGAYLGLSILGALGLEALPEKPHLKFFIPALLLGDYLLLSPAPISLADASVPGFYKELSGDADSYALVDLPALEWNSVKERYIYFSAVHNKKIPYELEDIACDRLLKNDFFRACKLISDDEPQTLEKAQIRDGIKELASENFRFIVLHRRLCNSVMLKNFRQFLTEYLGERIHSDEEVEVWVVASQSEVNARSKIQENP